MTDERRVPREVFDRRLPLEQRKRLYREWAEQHAWHTHPGHRTHGHPGGDRIHTHDKHR